MKAFKRIFVAVIMTLAICCFTACGGGEQSLDGTMTVVIGTETPVVYTVDLKKVEITNGVLSVLEYLNKTEDMELGVETSAYGTYLTKVGELEGDFISGISIYIYTSVESDFDVSVYAQSIEYQGKTLWSSGLGVSEMTLENDCVIYIGIIAY